MILSPIPVIAHTLRNTFNALFITRKHLTKVGHSDDIHKWNEPLSIIGRQLPNQWSELPNHGPIIWGRHEGGSRKLGPLKLSWTRWENVRVRTVVCLQYYALFKSFHLQLKGRQLFTSLCCVYMICNGQFKHTTYTGNVFEFDKLRYFEFVLIHGGRTRQSIRLHNMWRYTFQCAFKVVWMKP